MEALVAEAVAGAMTGKCVDYVGLRGPAAPFFLCTECGSVSDVEWVNPLLVTMKKLGLLDKDADITGGSGFCTMCEPNVMARFATQQPGPRMVVDCPKEFQPARMANYRRLQGGEEAIAAAQRFLEEEARHDLYICGPVGTGKTRLAVSIANDLSQRLSGVRFVRVHTLMVKLQTAMNDTNEHESLGDYAAPPVLVLDDVGVEKGSDYSRRTLQTLYDMRRDLGRRTIWTSNLSIDQLGEFLNDDRLPSRIAGAADVVWLDGIDMRLHGRAHGEREAGED